MNDDLAFVRRAFRDPCTDPEASRRRTLALIEAGVDGPRRRRSPLVATLGVVAVAVAVVVLIVAVPLLVSGSGPRLVHPAVSPSASPAAQYRRPLELTVGLGAGGAQYQIVYGTTGGRQFIKIYAGSSDAFSGGVVLVYDPGTLDPAIFAGGDTVQVHGRTGHYITDFSIGKGRTGAVGWPDPSGAWVVVCGLTGVDKLVALGNALELGARHPLPAPYHLSYLPSDLSGVPISYAQNLETHTTGPDSVDSVLAFGGTPPELWHPYAGSFPDVPVTIRVNDRSASNDSHDGPPSQNKIAGLDSWYFTAGTFGLTGDAAVLVVKTGTCRVEISVNDKTKYPYEQLKRIVQGMQIHDCGKPATWSAALD